MATLPKTVRIVEVGPERRTAKEAKTVSSAKAQFIKMLAAAGLKEIEVAPFVHPKQVPATDAAGTDFRLNVYPTYDIRRSCRT
jgi:hypothetical protein